MIVNETVKKAVAEGVKLLDAHFPDQDWRKGINLDTFDIAESEVCILGQLFGSYEDGLNELELEYPCKYGFASNFNMDSSNAQLDFEWKRIISEATTPKYKVGDKFVGKHYSGSKMTIKGIWSEDGATYYGFYVNGGYGRRAASESELGTDWVQVVPFPFKKGDVVRDITTRTHLFLVTGEDVLWRLDGHTSPHADTMTYGSLESYKPKYGELEVLRSVSGVSMSEKLA